MEYKYIHCTVYIDCIIILNGTDLLNLIVKNRLYVLFQLFQQFKLKNFFVTIIKSWDVQLLDLVWHEAAIIKHKINRT